MAKRDIKFLINDIKEATITAAREAAVDIMNSLATQGPVWTGKFSSAWYAVPSGGSAGGARKSDLSEVYRYDKRNVPTTRFKAGNLYKVVNGMSYAAEAMDLVPFKATGRVPAPIKPEKIDTGNRPAGGRRGDLSAKGSSNRATAPLDWYLTYVNGGGLNRDLKTGASRGFGTFKPRGFRV
jgi:hypothetical protein